MYPRTEYEMTQKDLEIILEACKAVPVMKVGSYSPPSPQENANRAWKVLGEKMGFDSTTVRQPQTYKGARWFTAIPSETEEQKDAREKEEKEDKRQADILRLENEIKERQIELGILKEGE